MAPQPIITERQVTATRPPQAVPEHHLSVLLAQPAPAVPAGFRPLLEQVKKHLVAVLFRHHRESDTERLLQDINWALAQPDQHRPALTLGDVLHRRRTALRRTQTLFRSRAA